MQKQRMRKTGNTKRGIFPTILESCAARSATEPGRSVWMYSFYRMWTSHARNVAVPGTRKGHGRSAMKINRETGIPCPELMEMDVNTALQAVKDLKLVHQRLGVLKNLGLGYLTLGEETPSLSGGEAQRLKLASEMGKGQSDSVFVFDEPTIGLHPLDVQTLLGVFQALVDNGATVLVIEHDLDVIRNADYIIDMGPGGGEEGGRVVACGTPEQIAANEESVTGKYL